MGHLVGKDIYRELGRKIDGLTMRAPWSDKLRALLGELYSEDDARLVAAMPWGFSRITRLEKVTGTTRVKLEAQLASLCPRGLVMDVFVGDDYYYAPSPMVIGIFEFTMMRTGGDLPMDRWARLFRDYLEEGGLYRANFGEGQQVSLMRAVPHDGSIAPDDYVEVLDYEKAAAIVDRADRFAIGLCSCRHEHEHAGGRTCKVPLDTCSSFGDATVGFMVRNGLAREVSKAEMLDNIARSRDLGLVLNADNVQRNVTFMCHCCGCCCNVLRGISLHGYPNAVVTSSYIAESDRERCSGCGICSRACPIQAISRAPDPEPRFRKFGRPVVDNELCIGCGVCTLRCKPAAMRLHKRKQRVLHPETTFERIILQCLERGTLQNQLFDNPASLTHAFARACLGGFLRLTPVKRALMGDVLRSRFLGALKQAAAGQGKGRFAEL
ncbi:MAG TPA: 4Fe-4S dicluster domain-containing protein [Burkholderiaceae bacterium]|nr:4Fe-4S dicluster domain-containing protein [Burkholderiaceae bacterium]